MTDAREAAARAILVKVPDGYGMTMHEALGYVDAVLSTAVPADVEAVCERLDAAASEREQVCLDFDVDPRTDAALNALIEAVTLIRAQAAQLAEARGDLDVAFRENARTALRAIARAEAAEAESARLREALTEARKALQIIDEGALGWVRRENEHGEPLEWPIRDELVSKIDAALNGGKDDA